ncbi:hypothetical protein [Desulfobacter postgatei]|uniref:Uncharacterized protein n=1 Tax=Desulfobacter postgatei 2ac9 TaxID=879212 RepID=I5B568_9BACT|nr:hypothetical protein [Desulfobacter postgatei]EIM64631.1 hypothetical protein DespoDRAFT_02811 [Desulfobacter postgatei 2ac9]
MVAENEIIPIANKVIEIGDREPGYHPVVRGHKKERRKRMYDRRKSVREGVIVTLSFKKDRRKNPDRRFRTSGGLVPKDHSKGLGCDIIA